MYNNENLDKLTYNLFKRGRILKKEGKIIHIWHRNGKIFVRNNEGSKTMLIRNEDFCSITGIKNDNGVDSLVSSAVNSELNNLEINRLSSKSMLKKSFKKKHKNSRYHQRKKVFVNNS